MTGFMMIWPTRKAVPWAVRKRTALRVVSEYESLYYCEMDDPPGGAHHVRLNGGDGVEAVWPDYETAPPEVHGLLTGLHESAGTPAQGENASE